MSGVQRYEFVAPGLGNAIPSMAADGEFVTYADHARIVAEKDAALMEERVQSGALLLTRQQQHEAALAEAEAASTVAVGMTVEAALAECIVEVVRVDSFEDIAGHFLKDRDEVEDAIRRVFHKWANKAAAPRTLTADGPEPVSLDDMGTDGQKWAQAFVDRFGGDEGLMIGWFANAIEAGRTAGMASGYPIEQPNLMRDGEGTPQEPVFTVGQQVRTRPPFGSVVGQVRAVDGPRFYVSFPKGVHYWYSADELAAIDGEATT